MVINCLSVSPHNDLVSYLEFEELYVCVYALII